MTVKRVESSPALKNKKSSNKFRPSATESFVIVKPPPTVSAHHPLNLQIQYIPPAGCDTARRRRTSTSSASEVSGSETSSSSSRNNGRIVPLYNLHTHSHNLLANSIHDAGTDEKIAKFHKHGVEVANVGLFAPVEAWRLLSASVIDPEDAPATCTSAGFLEPVILAEPAHEPQSRKLLGKFFHGKPARAPPSREVSPSRTSSNYHPEFALGPVLGTTPTLFSRTVPPVGRAVTHTFICKKWCKVKEGEDSWLAHAIQLMGHERCGVDIRIEWARGNAKQRDGDARKSSSMSNLRAEAEADVPPVPSLPSANIDDSRGQSTGNLTIPRPLFSRKRSMGSQLSGSTGRISDVSDAESDPEDSEVPWMCTIVIRASNLLAPHPHVPTGNDEKQRQDTTPLRLKVASLAPAPHHPKVVAQLKVQWPLPDCDLWNAALLPARKDSEEAPEGKHILTAEEIKDVVCSTVMWIVVREGFSGLLKKVKPRLS